LYAGVEGSVADVVGDEVAAVAGLWAVAGDGGAVAPRFDGAGLEGQLLPLAGSPVPGGLVFGVVPFGLAGAAAGVLVAVEVAALDAWA